MIGIVCSRCLRGDMSYVAGTVAGEAGAGDLLWSRAARASGSRARGWPGRFLAAAVVVLHSGPEGGTYSENQTYRKRHTYRIGRAKHNIQREPHFSSSIY